MAVVFVLTESLGHYPGSDYTGDWSPVIHVELFTDPMAAFDAATLRFQKRVNEVADYPGNPTVLASSVVALGAGTDSVRPYRATVDTVDHEHSIAYIEVVPRQV